MSNAIKSQILRLKNYQFLFEELVKRDFKKKYKRTNLRYVLERPQPSTSAIGDEFCFHQFLWPQHGTLYDLSVLRKPALRFFQGLYLRRYALADAKRRHHQKDQSAKISLSPVQAGFITHQFRSDTHRSILPLSSEMVCRSHGGLFCYFIRSSVLRYSTSDSD